jgi:hypothetical protein
MKMSTKVTLLTLAIGLPLLALGPIIWPPTPEIHPTAAQMPFLIVLASFEAFAFGLGVSFLVFGYPYMKRASGSDTKLTWAAYVSIAWLFLNWWPHGSLHVHNGLNINGVILIDYAFHVPIMVATAIVAIWFYRQLPKEKSRHGSTH